ncbi:MAG: hypothetical protein HQL01_08970 [Nitrospirae bacterium]|nr:hypothetical protein [Nitrospirota bacterium]
MKLRYILSSVLVLLLSGNAIAGVVPAPSTAVPIFTPLGSLLAAAAFGISGLYIILRKRK